MPSLIRNGNFCLEWSAQQSIHKRFEEIAWVKKGVSSHFNLWCVALHHLNEDNGLSRVVHRANCCRIILNFKEAVLFYTWRNHNNCYERGLDALGLGGDEREVMIFRYRISFRWSRSHSYNDSLGRNVIKSIKNWYILTISLASNRDIFFFLILREFNKASFIDEDFDCFGTLKLIIINLVLVR